MVTVSFPGGGIDCSIALPASKSISNRLLIIRALSGSSFDILSLSGSEDTVVLERLLKENRREINAGDGGTTFRFLLAYLALKGDEHVLEGSARLNERPVKELVETLNKLGASIEYCKKKNYPPLCIHPSALHGGRVSIDASVSSQFTSALLLIAPCLEEGLELHLQGRIVSPSYINMTVQLMKRFGIMTEHSGNVIHVEPGIYCGQAITVEADWSSAAYWMSIASLSRHGRIVLKDLSLNSLQGDAVLASVAPSFGVRCAETQEGLVMEKTTSTSSHFEYDFTDCPDLAPPLAILCAARGMQGALTGIETLREKESDRVEAILSVLHRMGGKAEYGAGRLVIQPGKLQAPGKVLPVFGDHRIALSLAPLSQLLGPLKIENGQVVKKSYPGFWDDLRLAGFKVA